MDTAPVLKDFNIDLTQKIDRFAFIVIDRWYVALRKYQVGVTGALMSSFTKELKKNGGDLEAVIFKFLKYGRFDDMGVGRGMTINERLLNRKFDQYQDSSGKSVGKIPRKKKPWYTKTFYREVAKFRDFYKQEYGDQLIGILENNLKENITLNP